MEEDIWQKEFHCYDRNKFKKKVAENLFLSGVN